MVGGRPWSISWRIALVGALVSRDNKEHTESALAKPTRGPDCVVANGQRPSSWPRDTLNSRWKPHSSVASYCRESGERYIQYLPPDCYKASSCTITSSTPAQNFPNPSTVHQVLSHPFIRPFIASAPNHGRKVARKQIGCPIKSQRPEEKNTKTKSGIL